MSEIKSIQSNNSEFLEINQSKNKTIRLITILTSLMSVSAWTLAFYFYYSYDQISIFHFIDYQNLPMKFEINIVVLFMFGSYFIVIKLVFIYFLATKKDSYIISILNHRANYFFIVNDVFMSFSLGLPLIFYELIDIITVIVICLSAFELVR